MESLPFIIDKRRFYMAFKGRTDRVGIYNAATCKIVSMEVKKGDWEIAQRIEAHLGGQARLGIHNHLQDNTCPWALVIFDEASGNPTGRDSLFFASEGAKLGLRDIKRERTKVKGENYECWLFFEKPLPVRKVRHLLTLMLKKFGISKVEVLPNEDDLTTGSFGNYAWLPYFGGTDKWMTESGESRVDYGMKMGFTIFIDEEGKPLKDPFATIHRYTEEEVDNAILYLSEYIPPEPSPEEGIRILDSHLRKLSEKCDGFKAMTLEVRDKRILREEGLTLLGLMLGTLNRPDYLHKLLAKTADYDKDYYDKKIQALTGRAFRTCAEFKATGYCPKEKVCFDRRPPLSERFGKFDEDKNKPPELWREPSPVQWIFQGIKERMGEEGEAETAVIDIDVKSQEEFLVDFDKEIVELRGRVIKSKRNFSGYDTGFPSLNQVLDGLKADTLITLAGPQGTGKTAFALQLTEQVAQLEGVPCAFIAYSETKQAMTVKMLSRISGMDYRKISRALLNDEELIRVKQAAEKIKASYGKHVFIIEGNDSLGIKKIKTLMDFASPKFIVIDSIGQLPFISKQNISDISLRIEQNMSQLKTLARYQKIPLLAVFSSRDKELSIEGALMLESLIMQASDVFLQMEEKGPLTGPAESSSPGSKELTLTVRKNKGGEKNIVMRFGYQLLVQKLFELK
ncbi:MAG: DnaB-like helicase C-terminal domain-containing protein [Candidatus Eremiobacteraeota bacterium]|nr:DnaB-like helicase C-terminal domain-containing protein [Candidatus Eremiobacteraeota bacterium]